MAFAAASLIFGGIEWLFASVIPTIIETVLSASAVELIEAANIIIGEEIAVEALATLPEGAIGLQELGFGWTLADAGEGIISGLEGAAETAGKISTGAKYLDYGTRLATYAGSKFQEEEEGHGK